MLKKILVFFSIMVVGFNLYAIPFGKEIPIEKLSVELFLKQPLNLKITATNKEFYNQVYYSITNYFNLQNNPKYNYLTIDDVRNSKFFFLLIINNITHQIIYDNNSSFLVPRSIIISIFVAKNCVFAYSTIFSNKNGNINQEFLDPANWDSLIIQ